ncbi:amino acid ABC transporter permease [Methylobacterium brachythecii]|uniref:Amino acid ABC transporter permease n=1 Tax=Methylobacterium brachythecii TaxID=1176177 RepID=A0A7W6AIR1_9HYPH|nr:ABC transporter permease subunit [Methylobacterium brachythecii]MBB3904105.1 polar amino acid transport system permease protein [Methylobacterium brachythecii]GLS42846.1 amino acid ABC transporter permease [Methylobacterium brachythecii]
MSGILVSWQYRDVFLWGVANTLSLVLGCLVLSVPLGILGAIMLTEAPAPLRRLFAELVDLLRCVPFLLLAYVVYYGLPELGLRLDPWWAGLVSLTLYNTAYLVEIFRAAFLGIARDNIEAAQAFGLSRSLLYRRIILPQVAITAAPVIGNQVITTIRDSALLMIITVQELTFAANFVSANAFAPFAPFAAAVGLYLLMSLAIEAGVRRMERMRRVRYG